MPETVTIYGHTSSPYDSYGLIMCEIVRHLSRNGVPAQGMPTNRQRARSEQDDEVRALMQRVVTPALGGIMMAYPTSFDAYGPLAWAGPRVALTMFESTKLPARWVDALNEMHLVIAPSRFVADTFRANGVTTQIRVIPLGLNDTYRYTPRNNGRPFTFLAIMDAVQFGRKGWDIAVTAFFRAFGNDPAYRLIVKARRDVGGPDRITNPNIDLMRQDLSEAEMAALYAECDCMVAPTRGEGFFLPGREFARSGGAVLATNWGGTADDLPQWGIPINAFTMVPAWPLCEPLKNCGEWAEVDIDALARQMREVAGIPLEARNQRGLEVSEFVTRRYRWDTFAREIVRAWTDAGAIEVMGQRDRVAYATV